MRHQSSTSHPARTNALAAKTRKVFGAVTKTIRRHHASNGTPASTDDLDFDGFYPAPFSRTFTPASQSSGSTGSTPSSSVLFSRHTSQATIAVPELKPNWEKAPALSPLETRAPIPQATASRTKGPFISILEEEENDGEAWGSYDSDDDDMLCIRRKRHAPPYNGIATSLVFNPFAAFLTHPSYKSPYLFPKVHHSVNAYYS
ncbi:hypothetical protein FS837_008903 [Tulasnella sp. UAMH 9824]|nr:hypothetical protein FS837_008903 [Tulasnella sp. UAMH 9824]